MSRDLPTAPGGEIARLALCRWLDAAVGSSAVGVISAPPGYGKSVLLRMWTAGWRAATANGRDGGLPLVGLSLTEADRSPEALRDHVARALQRAQEPQLRALGEGAAHLSPHMLPAHLLNALATGETVIVIDGYEHLPHIPVQFLDYLPPTLHLVLAGRGAPPVALGRLRMCGRLAELHAADLTFTPQEIAAYAATCAPQGAPPAGAHGGRAKARALGWPMGYALLWAAAQPETAVPAYFEARMAEMNAADFLPFLHTTAHLPTLTAQAVNTATGRHDGQATLETLEARGFWLLPLDAERRAWRYHPMFAEWLLIQRLTNSD